MASNKEIWTQEKEKLLNKMMQNKEPVKKIVEYLDIKASEVSKRIKEIRGGDGGYAREKAKDLINRRKEYLAKLLDRDPNQSSGQLIQQLPVELRAQNHTINKDLREMGLSGKRNPHLRMWRRRGDYDSYFDIQD